LDLYRVAILRVDFDTHPQADEYRHRVDPVDTTPFDRPDTPVV